LISSISGGILLLTILAFLLFRRRKATNSKNVEAGSRESYRKSLKPYTDKEFVQEEYGNPKTKSFLKPSEGTQDEIVLADLPIGTKQLLILHSYTPALDDELKLEEGKYVFLVREFDDGWALGVDPSGKQGAFPMVCVDTSSNTEKRRSSMILSKVNGVDVRSKRFSEYMQKLDE
jgi:hypothetical protein